MQNFNLEYFLNATPPSENQSLGELDYLINRKPINLNLVKSGDDVYGTFVKIVPQASVIIKSLIDKSVPIIKKLKNFHNRIRPHELAIKNGLNLQYVIMSSADTPSYPSGHSAQAYLIGTVLSHFFPEHAEELMRNAEMISISRVNARVHFPSDKWNGEELGRQLANEVIIEKSGYEELPFKEYNFDPKYKIRIFGYDTPSEELKWHIDGEDRVIEVLNDSGWGFQMEGVGNEIFHLPKKINSNERIFIKEGVYHRLIKGNTKNRLILKIEI